MSRIGSALVAGAIVLCAFSGAAPAAARTSAIARVPLDPDKSSLTVDSGQVLFGLASSNGSAFVASAPLAGGPAVTRFQSVPGRGHRRAILGLSADSGRLGFILSDTDTDGDLLGTSGWVGPLAGPYARRYAGKTTTRGGFFPLGLAMGRTGHALLDRSGGSRFRSQVIPDVGSPRTLPSTFLAVSGDLIAYGIDKPPRIVVANLASGAVLRTVPVPGGDIDESFDLAPDGRIVFVSPERATRGIWVIDAAGAPHRITVDPTDMHSQPHFAGDRIVAVRRNARTDLQQVVAVSAAGSTRLGPPATEVASLAADTGGVAWAGDGCAFAADDLGVVTLKIPAGPCPRSVADLVGARLTPRGLRVRLGCVTSDTARCGGTIVTSGRLVRRSKRFSIAEGRRQLIVVPLTRRGRSVLRRFPQGNRETFMRLRTASVDTAGRAYRRAARVDVTGIWNRAN